MTTTAQDRDQVPAREDQAGADDRARRARRLLARARRAVPVLGPGVVVLAVLSLWGLTTKEAWHDEVLSISATGELGETFSNTAYTMATYYLVLTGWIQVSDSIGWIRLLSVLFTLATVVALGVLVVRQRGTATARWSCLFLASSYLMVRFAQEARSYALAALLVTVAWWALDHVLADHDRRWLGVHVAACALVPLTHGLAVIAVLAQVVAAVLGRVDRRGLVWMLPSQLTTLAVVGLLWFQGGSEVGAGRDLTVESTLELGEQAHGGPKLWDALDVLGPLDLRVVLFAVTLLGVAVGLRSARAAAPGLARFRALTPTAWGVGVLAGLVVLSLVKPSMLFRYAVVAMPAIAVLQADAALAIHRRVSRLLRLPARWRRLLPLVPLAVLALHLATQVPLHREEDRRWTSTADVLAARARRGDGIIVPQMTLRMGLDYAWSQRDGFHQQLVPLNPVQPLGELERYGNYQGWSEVAVELEALDRVWMVEQARDQRNPAVVRFLELPEATEFDEVERHQFSSTVLVLMERAP